MITFFDAIREETEVGIEASRNAESPFLAVAHLEEVLRVILHTRSSFPGLTQDSVSDLLHPLIQFNSNLVAMFQNDPVLWKNQQLAIHLLRDHQYLPTGARRFRCAQKVNGHFKELSQSGHPLSLFQELERSTAPDSKIISVTVSEPPGKVTGPSTRRHIVLLGGLSGDDAEGVYGLSRWFASLLQKPSILSYFTFHLFPLLNPEQFAELDVAASNEAHSKYLNTSLPTICTFLKNQPCKLIIALTGSASLKQTWSGSTMSSLQPILVKALQPASTLVPTMPPADSFLQMPMPPAIPQFLDDLKGKLGNPPVIALVTPSLYSLASRMTAQMLMLRSIINNLKSAPDLI
ncbi:MAG: hypothetical protein SGI71_06635 [Verrucomicrobiota bacterium]|nr:hypothetical protein [Verrucomicrobiota bacterium]